MRGESDLLALRIAPEQRAMGKGETQALGSTVRHGAGCIQPLRASRPGGKREMGRHSTCPSGEQEDTGTERGNRPCWRAGKVASGWGQPVTSVRQGSGQSRSAGRNTRWQEQEAVEEVSTQTEVGLGVFF